MASQFYLVAVLAALLVGLAIGKAWERYKLRDGRWIDRRRLRETPHYMLGLSFLVDNQVDSAIEELTRAAGTESDALEVQMILGNLYRQKGHVGRAINIHQSLLQRPDLTRAEHAYVLLCLGLDFRHGGFVDRALETFQEVVRLDPRNRYALVNLQKLYEDQHQWTDAVRVREDIAGLEGDDDAESRQILGFLRNEIGSLLARSGRHAEAAQAYTAAIDAHPATAPAYLNLGDARDAAGDLAGAVESWERLVDAVPDRAYLAVERLERAYDRLDMGRRFFSLAEKVIAQSPKDWRVRLALARRLASDGRHQGALGTLLEALPNNPHGLVIHQEIWRALLALDLDGPLVRRYVELTRAAVFYLDPHVCRRCRYRSTELLWQCPQCHEWNTFVEERLAPARDGAVALESIGHEP
jgi:lipopolysaccharide biosynthesis regulator YciM